MIAIFDFLEKYCKKSVILRVNVSVSAVFVDVSMSHGCRGTAWDTCGTRIELGIGNEGLFLANLNTYDVAT